MTWEGHRDEVQLCRDEVRKAKTKLGLNFVRDAKNNKRSSIDMLARKGRSKKVHSLINSAGKVVPWMRRRLK